MTWLSDAHSEWHAVNGRWGCPLDCAASDVGVGEEAEEAAWEEEQAAARRDRREAARAEAIATGRTVKV